MKFTKEKPVCNHCDSNMQMKEINHEDIDVNTKSLLIMFRFTEIVEVECLSCGYRKFDV